MRIPTPRALRSLAAAATLGLLLAAGLASARQPTPDQLRTDQLIEQREAADDRGDDDAAIAADRALLAHWERVYGRDSEEADDIRSGVAQRLADKGRTDEAVALMKLRLKPGLDQNTLAGRNLDIAEAYDDADRPKDAEHYLRAALAAMKDRKPADRRETEARLGKSLLEQGRPADAIPFLEAGGSKSDLAGAYEAVGRYKDAEPLRKGRALADNLEMQGRYKEAEPLLKGERLAQNLEKQGRMDEAVAVRRDLQAQQVAKAGNAPPQTTVLSSKKAPGADEQVKIADLLQQQGKHDQANREYAAACPGVRSRTFMFYDPATIKFGPRLTPQLEAIALNPPPTDLQACSRKRLISLWQLGGGAPDKAIVDQALTSVQDSLSLPGGDGLARGVAERVATNAGGGPIVAELKSINYRMSEAAAPFAQKWGSTAFKPDMPQADYEAMMKDMMAMSQVTGPLANLYETTHKRLLAKVPAILDYAVPPPVSVAELQTSGPRGQPLLRQNEVVVLFQFIPGADRGSVFAVSRTGAAWAQIGLSNTQLSALIAKVRAGVDSDDDTASFPRQAAYELHQALLSAPAIASVVDDGDRLMIVATGPTNSLPPGLLVTRPPTGDDADPAALRATPWLLREKTIAILPSLPSLRLLRSQEGRAAASGALMSLYDPSFSGKGGAAPGPARGGGRGARISRGAATTLALLPRLTGTRAEGMELATLFPGQANTLTDVGATEAALRAAAKGGKLRSLGVLHFATHGLEPKDIGGLLEPALALAGPGGADKAPDVDGLLTVSEIIALGMEADWVILSACNTATEARGFSGGISGLALGFMLTGSRSVLASHWRVDDDTSARIIIETVKLSRLSSNPLDRASALRTASLQILDDPSGDDTDRYLAHPRYWAPFVLMGAFE